MIERNFQIPFVARLALAEKQIQQNYRPLIAVHKWFARRPGTLFRSLLLAEFGEGAVSRNRNLTSIRSSQAWRPNPEKSLQPGNATLPRIKALVEAACDLIEEGRPPQEKGKLHRFDKADSADGLHSVRQLADMGVPYAMLLYERFLGRPFAGHRDSVSELVGDGLESAIEDQLTAAGITFRKTKRAERLAGFDQAPDFIIPDEFNPKVIIEAKLTEDDGTARDKATRVIRLCQMSEQRAREGKEAYEVIACLAGRGFGVRREDMRQMIAHTKGKIFTPRTLNRLVACSALKEFATRKWSAAGHASDDPLH